MAHRKKKDRVDPSCPRHPHKKGGPSFRSDRPGEESNSKYHLFAFLRHATAEKVPGVANSATIQRQGGPIGRHNYSPAMDAHLTPKHAVTILLPTKREAANLRWLCGALHEELDPHVRELEILVVDTPTGDGSEELCAELGARYVGDPTLGFADALRRGFQEATHDIIVTMDADGSHHPLYIRWMLYEIDDVDLVICSRYVGRGGQEATAFRYVTSLILNQWVGTVCSMPIRDLSGGFKMYRRSVLETINLDSTGFEIQCEIAINTYGNGFRLREIPFCYHPRLEGRSKAAVVKYGLAFLFGSMRLRRYRNSREFCDYDERAYKSRIPMQQWWQRTRYRKMIERMIPEGVTIDVGCGSGRIMLGWPKVIGIDVNKSVLRYPAPGRASRHRGRWFQAARAQRVRGSSLLRRGGRTSAGSRAHARRTGSGDETRSPADDHHAKLWLDHLAVSRMALRVTAAACHRA